MPLFDWLRRARTTRRLALPETTRACPHCGTALPDEARYCFMCGEKLVADDEGRSAASPSMMSGRAIAEIRNRLAGQLSGRYAIRDLIGAGGMGLVFRADDVSLERPVAIKVLPPDIARDTVIVARFQREAKTAARLDHPNIVPIYGVESGGGLHYFIMKFVAGRTLHQALRAGPAPFPIVVRVMRDAAAGLSHAHARGVVHRDVKPGNIILDEDGHSILTDFGISKVLRRTDTREDVTQLTEVGNTVGTPHYMAPEQALGQELDGRADQYSLAVIAFQLLTGALPFDAESPHAIIHLHINEAPPRLATLRPDVPPAMAAAIARALSKSPENRFGDIAEFAATLTAGAGQLATLRTLEIPSAAGEEAKPDTSAGEEATTLIRRTARETAAPRRKSHRAATAATGNPEPSTGTARKPPGTVWTALLVLVLCTGMAWAAWDHGEAPVPAPVDSTIVQAGSARDSARPATPPANAHSDDARRALPHAILGVASTPHATVYIDGSRVGETPLSGISLETGRAHALRLARAGYHTLHDTIRVTGTQPMHRRYLLHRQRRR